MLEGCSGEWLSHSERPGAGGHVPPSAGVVEYEGAWAAKGSAGSQSSIKTKCVVKGGAVRVVLYDSGVGVPVFD